MTFYYKSGTIPLLLSMPHNGVEIPDSIKSLMTEEGVSSLDSDHFQLELYQFAEDIGAHIIAPKWSRYVIDLNRPIDGSILYKNQSTTELCPLKTFLGKPIYKEGVSIKSEEIEKRTEQYWKPYHKKIRNILNQMKTEFGYGVLYEAHSIEGVLPRLFDGELPDLNIGTNSGLSTHSVMEEAIKSVLSAQDNFEYVLNGRFKGGFITRNYGNPQENIYAVQMELTKNNYMEVEPIPKFRADKAANLQVVLKSILHSLLESAQKLKNSN